MSRVIFAHCAGFATARSLACAIICDNGAEFTGKAILFWGGRQAIRLKFIQSGEPTQSAFIEILDGGFRNERLNRN